MWNLMNLTELLFLNSVNLLGINFLFVFFFLLILLVVQQFVELCFEGTCKNYVEIMISYRNEEIKFIHKRIFEKEFLIRKLFNCIVLYSPVFIVVVCILYLKDYLSLGIGIHSTLFFGHKNNFCFVFFIYLFWIIFIFFLRQFSGMTQWTTVWLIFNFKLVLLHLIFFLFYFIFLFLCWFLISFTMLN